MKLKILKIELAFQILLFLACGIWFILGGLSQNTSYILFYILPLLALSNLVGFLIRIFTVKSKWMMYYFFAVLIYLTTLFLMALSGESPTSTFSKAYLFGGSLLLSLFYTISGFFILKETKRNSEIILTNPKL